MNHYNLISREEKVIISSHVIKTFALIITFFSSLISFGIIFILFLSAAASLHAQGVPPQVVGGYTQLVLEYESIKSSLTNNTIDLKDSVRFVILKEIAPELTLFLPDSTQQSAILNNNYNILKFKLYPIKI